MSRLWSPAGGIPERPPPFGVWVGDRTPPAWLPAPPAAPAPPSRRRSLALLVVAGTLATAMVAGSVASMVGRLGASTPPRPGSLPAPTLAHLDAAIGRAESFLDGL